MRQLLEDAVSKSKSRTPTDDQVYAFGASIIEQAKRALDAANAPGGKYTGPNKHYLEAIIKGGIKSLVDTLGDWGLYAWCPYLRVVLRVKPSLNLASPRIDLSNFKIAVTATGELWAKYPWPACSQWCTSWKIITKCDRIASVTPTLDIKAAAHAVFQPNGAGVYAQASFDLLRLDYPILDQIPLELIANLALAGKKLLIYDASMLVETVPILKSHFTVGSITLPPLAGGIGITVKQIP